MPGYDDPNQISTDNNSPPKNTPFARKAIPSSQDRRLWPPDGDWNGDNLVRLAKQGGSGSEVSSRTELVKGTKNGASPGWVADAAGGASPAEQHPMGGEDRHLELPPCKMLLSETISRNHKTEHDQAPQKHEGGNSPKGLEPVEIERPRSALHTGDFFQKQSTQFVDDSSGTEHDAASPTRNFLSSSPTTPWYAPTVPHFSCTPRESSPPAQRTVSARSRAPSLGSSLCSIFVFRPPTSPLVYAASNADLDIPSTDPLWHGTSQERSGRRRTLPPDSFYSLQSASKGVGCPPNFSRPLPRFREASFPYQAHQPRRSLTSVSMNHSVSNPQTPMLPRSRGPSLSSDSSPIQHASMVGSFEESILRGRMSTAPSKPLDFVAQIGVLGRGDCKPHLRCPAHVTVPFPAVFYNYPSIGTRSFSDDSPSPYVGTIDLERSLKPIEAKKHLRRAAGVAQNVDALVSDATAPENTRIGQAIDRKRRERQCKRSVSPKGPVGGCYRVPQQGQLQIIIKNPNKTAVKLYLVPYSLDGMEAGTKTFVRQRSFSTGPILEKPLSDKPKITGHDTLEQKSILRYLIHLKFCCPSPGKYYLYDNIRVVFANRVPDGKENLKNEVQLPAPRYSSYRPSREPSMGKAGAKLAAEKASRRRSSGFGLGSVAYDAMDGLTFTGPTGTLPPQIPRASSSTAIPFHLGSRSEGFGGGVAAEVKDESASKDVVTGIDGTGLSSQKASTQLDNAEMSDTREKVRSPTTGFILSTSRRASPVPWTHFSFGGNAFGSNGASRTTSPTPGEPGEGLLSQKFRNIEAQQSNNGRT